MQHSRFDTLPESPFPRLNALIDGIEPGKPPMILSLGEPKHAFPAFVTDEITANAADFGRYPPIVGTPAFRMALKAWLERRYGLAEGLIDAEKHILPVNGTREALFNVTLVATPEAKGGARPAVLMPNPFYQCYAAAALAAGAEPVYLPATAENGFLPDYAGLDEALLARTSVVYFCSPANPQGVVADKNYLQELIGLARRFDFLLVVDECYSEIYDRTAPAGALEAAVALDDWANTDPFRNLVVFNSLSKRSSLPGLRSGFCAGDPVFLQRYRSFRNIAAPQVPLPLLAASTRVWSEEAHVEENRALYRRKLDIAERILGNRFGFFRPPGGFFLWLDVGDGEAAARELWARAGVKVLPGAYLSRPDATVPGGNPGNPYIRVALVDPVDRTEEALTRMADALG